MYLTTNLEQQINHTIHTKHQSDFEKFIILFGLPDPILPELVRYIFSMVYDPVDICTGRFHVLVNEKTLFCYDKSKLNESAKSILDSGVKQILISNEHAIVIKLNGNALFFKYNSDYVLELATDIRRIYCGKNNSRVCLVSNKNEIFEVELDLDKNVVMYCQKLNIPQTGVAAFDGSKSIFWGATKLFYVGVNGNACLFDYSTVTIISFCNVASLHSGAGFFMYLDNDGKIYSMGKQMSILGTDANISFTSNTEIGMVKLEEKITTLITSNTHAIALTETGNVYGWGSNNSGQLGLPELEYFSPVKLDIVNVRAAYCIRHFTIFLLADSTVKCFGSVPT